MINEVSADRCSFCSEEIHYLQFVATTHRYQISLCSPCEREYTSKRKYSTKEEAKLYVALRGARIPATLQHYDGYKTVDIAINDINLHIEVDGPHHQTSGQQALADLQRSVYSLRKDVATLRIPNAIGQGQDQGNGQKHQIALRLTTKPVGPPGLCEARLAFLNGYQFAC